jgi:serine/threonine-protein kinase HipA
MASLSDLRKDYEHWIVKFRAPEDAIDAGAVEKAYAEMAVKAGVAGDRDVPG